LRPGVPSVLGRFLRRCLEKVPEQGLRDVGDLRLALDVSSRSMLRVRRHARLGARADMGRRRDQLIVDLLLGVR
jgi:hypothetical protein